MIHLISMPLRLGEERAAKVRSVERNTTSFSSSGGEKHSTYFVRPRLVQT